MRNNTCCIILLAVAAWGLGAGAAPVEAAPAESTAVEHKPAAADTAWWPSLQKGLSEAVDKQRENTPPREGTSDAPLAAAEAAAPASSTGPGASGTSSMHMYLKSFSALCIVLALILITGVAVKRFGKQTALFSGPALGKVLGHLYLMPRVSIHFVRIGGKVLVIGVNQNSVALLSEFDAATFGEEDSLAGLPSSSQPADFQGHLESHLRAEAMGSEPRGYQGDREAAAEIAALRAEVQRLHRYLENEG